MTAPESHENITTSTEQSTVGRWIEDPFASVIAGIVIPTFAFAFLLTAMGGLALIV